VADGAGGPQLLDPGRGAGAHRPAPVAASAVAGEMGRAAGPGPDRGVGGRAPDRRPSPRGSGRGVHPGRDRRRQVLHRLRRRRPPYSGSLGGVALCQVTVNLTYVTARGHTIIDRRLYLPRDWACDEERRELAGVPDHIEFATKP